MREMGEEWVEVVHVEKSKILWIIVAQKFTYMLYNGGTFLISI
jgi:hypothetical protein